MSLDRLPAAKFADEGEFLDRVDPGGDTDDLLYFCCNVGDADAQVLILPGQRAPQGSGLPDVPRRAVVVDAGRSGKVDGLLEDCVEAGLLEGEDGQPARDSIALVIATHPHQDHIGGMPRLLERMGDAVAEFWDPGYYHPIRAYHEMMAEIEKHPTLVYAQPSAGLRRWIGQTGLTVLAPSIGLRNRFDTYGIEINDSSIGLVVEYPATRVVERDDDRDLLPSGRSVKLVLGADAQTASWAHVEVDFPELHAQQRAAGAAIKESVGPDMLSSRVLKVAHHASKRGVNLELVERISPMLQLVSCADVSRRHHFPHAVAREILREAVHPTEGIGDRDTPDWRLGIHYTGAKDDTGTALGTIGMRLGPQLTEMWRFGDRTGDRIRFERGRRWTG